MPKFDDKENKRLNKNIKSLVNEMTKDLKNCKILIKEIINENNNDIDLDLNNLQIKKNLKQNILNK